MLTDSAKSPSWYCDPEARGFKTTAPSKDPELFHRSLPGYDPTGLVEVSPSIPGISRTFVKDESHRLGLPAFKILGASWACYRSITDFFGVDDLPADFAALKTLVSESRPIQLVTATDGNHGRALAHMARLLGAACTVFAPDITPDTALRLIESEGATLEVIADDYDKTVIRAAEYAASEPSAILVQDTSWDGYIQIPQWIVDGYSTMFYEVEEQLLANGIDQNYVLVVPTGVGSLLQSAIEFAHSRPSMTLVLAVEPVSANCVTVSLDKNELTSVQTSKTNMAGLNCGTPSNIAWPILAQGLDASMCIDDPDATAAAADLASAGISSGPCGAASLAGLQAFLADESRRKCFLNGQELTAVLINTEGAS